MGSRGSSGGETKKIKPHLLGARFGRPSGSSAALPPSAPRRASRGARVAAAGSARASEPRSAPRQ
eukprot:7051202-Pyramimonas_sp.AAC.1